jgi:hypothetical protein
LQDKRHGETHGEKNKNGGMVERVFNDDKLSPHSTAQRASDKSARKRLVTPVRPSPESRTCSFLV